MAPESLFCLSALGNTVTDAIFAIVSSKHFLRVKVGRKANLLALVCVLTTEQADNFKAGAKVHPPTVPVLSIRSGSSDRSRIIICVI